MTSVLSDLEAEFSPRWDGSKLPQVDEVVGGKIGRRSFGSRVFVYFPSSFSSLCIADWSSYRMRQITLC